jgi:hypothetical protein
MREAYLPKYEDFVTADKILSLAKQKWYGYIKFNTVCPDRSKRNFRYDFQGLSETALSKIAMSMIMLTKQQPGFREFVIRHLRYAGLEFHWIRNHILDCCALLVLSLHLYPDKSSDAYLNLLTEVLYWYFKTFFVFFCPNFFSKGMAAQTHHTLQRIP